MSDAVNSLRRCSSMRALLLVCPLSLFLAGGAALAQSVQRTELSTQKSEEEIKAIRERAIEWYNTCMEDWDQGTHMTKKEWKTTCERVQESVENGSWKIQLWTPSSIVERRADGPNFSLPPIKDGSLGISFDEGSRPDRLSCIVRWVAASRSRYVGGCIRVLDSDGALSFCGPPRRGILRASLRWRAFSRAGSSAGLGRATSPSCKDPLIRKP